MAPERQALDLSDPLVREMAERNHTPAERWLVGGHLIGVHCDACSQLWPCATRQALDRLSGRCVHCGCCSPGCCRCQRFKVDR